MGLSLIDPDSSSGIVVYVNTEEPLLI